jgi:hypothetical protein
MSTIEEHGMTKAIIELGWQKYVLDLKDAVTVGELLNKAEKYEEKYVKDADSTVHIYENTAGLGSIRLIGDSLYQMAKLAGPPPKD